MASAATIRTPATEKVTRSPAATAAGSAVVVSVVADASANTAPIAAIITVETSALMARLALSTELRSIANRIKGDAALASTSTKRPAPKTATSYRAMLNGPKLPRPIVMASA